MSRTDEHLLMHASAVAVDGNAVLILGRSGAGKSGLVLRMLTLGADLVGDDQVRVWRSGEGLAVSPVPAIAGKIEARGVGILCAPFVERARVVLAADLDAAPEARLPQALSLEILVRKVELIRAREVANMDAILMVMLRHGRAHPGGG